MDRKRLEVLRRHRAAMAGLALLLLFALAAAAAGASPYDPDRSSADEQFQPPTARHWFGTDHQGRDILTRISYGARISLLIGTACVVFAIVVGVPLGAAAGYFGGWVDLSVSRLVDVLLSFPSILLAIAIAAPLGADLRTVIVSVGIVGVPQFARQARGSVLALREQEFVTAARALGAGDARILFRSILPNALGPLIVLATLGVGSSILMAAALSYLGLGVEVGTAEWGHMFKEGFNDYKHSPWPALFPGLAISLAVLGFNLFGDGLRDALDPRSRETR